MGQLPPAVPLSPSVTRIGFPGLYADLVAAGDSMVRLGAVPDIAKALQGREAVHVIVPPWQATPLGDSFAGEEFVMWRALFGTKSRHYYYGPDARLARLRRRLEHTVPYDFDESRTRIVRRDWLDDVFTACPGDNEWQVSGLTVNEAGGQFTVSTQGTVIHRYPGTSEPGPDINVGRGIIPAPADGIEVIVVGSGNGFVEQTASFIIRWGTTALWVDPPPYPLQSLAGLGLHPDMLTAAFITHNHEDHISGVVPLADYAARRGRKLQLLAAAPVFELLREQLAPYPLNDTANWTGFPVPGHFSWEGASLTTRWNHHILPSGTVGLKVAVDDTAVGISGDTWYTPEFAEVLGNPDLAAAWFDGCQLVFHEVAPDTGFSVHTRPRGLADLQQRLPGVALRGYHCAPGLAPELCCPRATRGEKYVIMGGFMQQQSIFGGSRV